MVAVGTAAGIALSGHTKASPRFSRLSNHGTRIARVAGFQRRQLLEAGLLGELRLLREQDGYRLYVEPSAGGETCYLTSKTTVHSPEFGVIACPSNGASAFPSPKAPILDLSPLAKAPGAALPRTQAVIGFAADGVAAAGLLDSRGNVHRVPVRRNTYISTALSGLRAQGVVAYDSSGAVVYRHSFTP